MPKKKNKTPVDINEGQKLFNSYYEKKHKGKPDIQRFFLP